jgi:gamma-glutamylputrescine oxidase
MKMLSFLPQDQVFWYLNQRDSKPLQQNISTDVVVIGGGMAGLTAAQSFSKRGLRVVLLEKNFCGSGASGKSSGFVTPNSELSLNDLIRLYGEDGAKKLWKFIESGVAHIRTNIQQFTIDCDYQQLDTLVLANTKRAFKKEIVTEHNHRLQLGYESALYQQNELSQVVASQEYQGGMSYGNSFGIQVYRYCNAMKRILQESGVQIFEETPVIDIKDHVVTTPYAQVQAEHIIVCTDRFAHALDTMWDKIYRVQTFLMLSSPLTQAQVKRIFPHEHYMVWDTDLVYNYYRLTGDNRLMLGGASVLSTYFTHETHNPYHIAKKLIRSFNKKFPDVNPTFEYIWPGLIGITKDIFPIAGKDQTMPSVYYLLGATGLPWAAALGIYSAHALIDQDTTFDHCFSPYRPSTFGPITQSIVGPRLTFALSNFLVVGSI